jgi:urease accessory protein
LSADVVSGGDGDGDGNPSPILNLRLLQIADSALPIGGYTHSWGLEAAIARRLVRDAESLERWAGHWLRHAIGPLEGVVVAAACRAATSGDWTAIDVADDLLTAMIAPPSIRAASRAMGAQLLGLASTWTWSAPGVAAFGRSAPPGRDRRPCHHAAAFGLLAALAGASPLDATLAYLHQAIAGMIGAGVRALPVGHTHGQQILAYLHEELVPLAVDWSGRPPARAGAGSPFYEVLCDEQTRLDTRLFRS